MKLPSLHNPRSRSEGIVKLPKHTLPANSLHTLQNKTLCKLQSHSVTWENSRLHLLHLQCSDMIPPFFLVASSPLTHCFPSGKPHSIFEPPPTVFWIPQHGSYSVIKQLLMRTPSAHSNRVPYDSLTIIHLEFVFNLVLWLFYTFLPLQNVFNHHNNKSFF